MLNERNVMMTASAVCHLHYLVHLGYHLREQGVQGGEFPAKVNIPLKSRCVGDCLWIWDFKQETLHIGPLVLKELVHEGHVLFLVTKSDRKQRQEQANLENLPVSAKMPVRMAVCLIAHSLGEIGQILGDFGD